ncbi:RHS repeat protein, partial [Salmonella enterica subsp. enterica serovar Newport]
GRSGQMYDHDRYYYDKAGNLLDNEGQGAVMNNRLPGCGRDRYLTGRSGQMYDHDRYYYDKAGNLLDNEGQGAVMNNRLPGCGR